VRPRRRNWRNLLLRHLSCLRPIHAVEGTLQ
jgi:hypothetical protein